MSDQSLGTISALVRLKLDSLAADAAAVKATMSGMAQSASDSVSRLASVSAESFARVGQVAKQAGRDMELAGAAILGGLGVAVKSGEDWNQTLLHISGNTSMSKQQTEEMRSVVEHLGQTAAAPLDRLANGYMHVTNFAFKGAEATKILTEVTKYAVATGDDASKVSEVLAGTLHNFAMGAGQAGGAMNLLHTAAARANSTLGEFASAAGPAFAAAHTYGISLAEAAAAIQVFTQHQYTASEGTTLFANLVEHVANPTRITKKALEDLGLTHSQLARDMTFTGLQAVGVAGFLKHLDEAAKSTGKSSEELAKTLFRGRMGGTGTAVLVQNLREYTKAAKDLQEIFDKGAAGIWQFDAANKSLTGQVEILKNNFVILSGQIESALLPMLNDVLNSVHELVTWFQNLTTPQKEMIVQVTAIAGVALLASGAVLALVGSIASFVASLTLAMPALAAVGAALLPFVGWIAAIGAAVALLAVAWAQDWGNIREYTQQFVDWVKPYLSTAWEDIRAVMGFAMAIWKKDWGTVFYDLGQITRFELGRIKADFSSGLDAIRDVVHQRGQVLSATWSTVLDIMRNGGLVHYAAMKVDWNGFWSGLIAGLRAEIANIVATIHGFFGAMRDAGAGLWNSFYSGFTGAANPSATAARAGSLGSVPGAGMGTLASPGGAAGAILAAATHTPARYGPDNYQHPPHFSGGEKSGGGGGGRGGGGSSALDDLKERALEVKRAINEAYDALYKLTHNDFENRFRDAMKEFMERRTSGVPEPLNAEILARQQLKIAAEQEEDSYQRKIALQKRANEAAYNMLEPSRKLAEQTQATYEFVQKYASVLNDQVVAAFAKIHEADRRKADSAISSLLDGNDLGAVGRKWDEFFTKIVEGAKKASKEIEKLGDAAVDGAVKGASEARKALTGWDRLLQKMSDGMVNVFEGAFTDLFEHGWKSFFRDILQGFTKMLEQMVAQMLAKSIIFGFLSLFGGGLPGQKSFFSFLGFDDASNDRQAEHWGFDFADMFGRGIKDFDQKRGIRSTQPAQGTVVHAPITLHAVINHEMDIRTVADRLAWHMQTRGTVYQGTG